MDDEKKLEDRITRELDTLYDWKILRKHEQYAVFSKEYVAMKIFEYELLVDKLIDKLCEVRNAKIQ